MYTYFWNSVTVIHHFLSVITQQVIDSLDINECEEQPCQNNGSCANTNGTYICNCTSGYNGTNCEFGK